VGFSWIQTYGEFRGNSGGIHGINVGFKHVLTGWWFGTWLLFLHILGKIIPTDKLIFFRGVESTNQLTMFDISMMVDRALNRVNQLVKGNAQIL
jgi:hypothetical protein